ncbi:MAG: hypothetical protein HY725_04135 [Candidatus Rokubacteria bacterium]|nr:hypothetical protein [Candidatus Rokubacteria bacterium]
MCALWIPYVTPAPGSPVNDGYGPQPFFIAEPYTKRQGSHVSREETVRVCAGILAGEYDDVPEQAFYFKGGLDEILASARS